jgi:hypothetical protein
VKEFEHILNWRLLKGSHGFPGRDGGTCINEAAIVAAGFEYRSVEDVGDMPPCFSPVIAQYALALNDRMPGDQRQRLLPFVARLAGTADEPGVELHRAEHLALEACRRFLSCALDAAGLPDHASRCRAVRTLNGAQTAVWAAARAVADVTAEAVAAVWAATDTAVWAAAEAAARAAVRWAPVEAAARAASLAADVDAASAGVGAALAARSAAGAGDAVAWDDAIAMLEGVLAIGRQAEPLDAALVAERLERAKEAAHIRPAGAR